jgi:hypothetical protein
VKPVEFRRFAAVLKQIEVFWMTINQPPQVDNAVGASSPHRAA